MYKSGVDLVKYKEMFEKTGLVIGNIYRVPAEKNMPEFNFSPVGITNIGMEYIIIGDPNEEGKIRTLRHFDGVTLKTVTDVTDFYNHMP